MIDDNLCMYLDGYSSPLLVAVSGGMDSIVLLHMLLNQRDQYPFMIHVATFDHALRAESGEDVLFVVDLCAEWGVPCITGKVEQPLTGNLESAAREARYRFLARTAHHIGAEWVLTAHHADDQAETILLHILRGSGLRGLGGMQVSAPLPYDEQLHLLRPMLSLSRAQIETYCHENQLAYRHDVTNDDKAYRRNYIRHDLLPMMETVNQDVIGALNRLGEIAQQDYQFLSDVAQTEFDQALMGRGDDFIALNRDAFYRLHVAIQRQLLFKMAWELYQLSPTHERMAEAEALIHSEKVGTFIDFIGSNALYLNYKTLILGDYQAYFRQTLPYVRLEKEAVIEIDLTVSEQVHHGDDWGLQITRKRLDHGVRLGVEGVRRAVLRTRRGGDYFMPSGMGGRGKKLKAWMIDHKIPQVIRDEIGLVEFDGQIVAILYGEKWIIGYQPEKTMENYVYINYIR